MPDTYEQETEESVTVNVRTGEVTNVEGVDGYVLPSKSNEEIVIIRRCPKGSYPACVGDRFTITIPREKVPPHQSVPRSILGHLLPKLDGQEEEGR